MRVQRAQTCGAGRRRKVSNAAGHLRCDGMEYIAPNSKTLAPTTGSPGRRISKNFSEPECVPGLRAAPPTSSCFAPASSVPAALQQTQSPDLERARSDRQSAEHPKGQQRVELRLPGPTSQARIQ